MILFTFQQFFYSEIFEVGDLPYVLLNYLILLVFVMSFLLFYALVVRMVYVATKKKPSFSIPQTTWPTGPSRAGYVRTSVLAGRNSRICHFMTNKWDKPDFEKLIAGN